MQWKAGASGAGQGFAPRRPRNESTQPRAWPGIASIFLTILIGGQDRKALKTPELARGFPPLGRSCPLAAFLLTGRGTRSPTSRRGACLAEEADEAGGCARARAVGHVRLASPLDHRSSRVGRNAQAGVTVDDAAQYAKG